MLPGLAYLYGKVPKDLLASCSVRDLRMELDTVIRLGRVKNLV